MLEFKVLGRLRVVVDGRDVPVTGAVDRILLMGLLVNANTAVDPVEIVGSVWDEEADLAASVRESVGRLEALVDGLPGTTRLRPQSGGYRLSVNEGLIDYCQAKAMYRQSKHHTPMHSAELLRDAFALWPETFEPDVAWSREVDALMRSIVDDLDAAVRTISRSSPVLPDDYVE
ncbi:AfsR/SARP family transcriptional regulator [Actinophytocola oryzae]|uniref:Transcriptional regulator n=1 Tax=Actinophytocola oryzae TaxID=502181 RepID=A0A4R7VQV9_9PSEU|nr:hypothetical protein [Actinophytocola oryzae]TDV52150.1 hypothetical protein CLV71_105281 [Actinophytocola oryzae]